VSSPFQQAAPTLTGKEYAADFEFLWTSFKDNYAYMRTKGLDWNAVHVAYKPRFEKASSRTEFLRLLEQVVDEMRDPHALVLTNDDHSPRLVPSGADIWASWHGSRAIIEEVRDGSPAKAWGLRAGMTVVDFGGRPIADAVAARLGSVQTHPTLAHRNWALRAVLAGYWSQKRVLTVSVRDMPRTVTLDPMPRYSTRSVLESRTLAGNVGYIRLHDSLGKNELIPAFDKALDSLRGTSKLVLDLRECPSGGDTTVARGIMGRLISREMPYQRHEVDEVDTNTKRVWIEYASPRGRPYLKPVVVLVDHWSGSMTEGLAVGLASMHRATTVGTEMAGLAGALESVRLPNTGIGVGFPTERLYLVDRRPRETYRPQVWVDLASPAVGGRADPILDRGLLAGAAR
jgi:C-terminal processing protease CtpA/Prc